MIGTTQITLKKDEGQFFCPECASHASYRRKVNRQFLTVYFIPLIPLGVNADFVECAQCRGQFDPSILGQSPEAIRQQLEQQVYVHLLRVMVLTMIADGVIDEAEMAAVQDYFRSQTGQQLTPEQIAGEIQLARRARATAASYAAAIRDKLRDRQKDWMIQGAFLVASAAGPIKPRQMAELKQLPKALQVSEERFRGLIEEAASL